MPTERERMLAGDLYLASDPDLVAARLRARRLTRAFNATTEAQPGDRARILSELFGAVGQRTEIEPPFHCDYGFNIRSGDGLFMNFGCIVLDCAHVTFGNGVLVGPGVHFYAATHPTDPAVRATGRELARPITIGNNVWIGGRAVIGPGINIGDGAAIGAGSIVTRDIPPNVIAAGNPARLLRQAGPDRPSIRPAPSSRSLEDVERDHILATLAQTNGAIAGPAGAASILGLPPSTLRSRMAKLGIKAVTKA